MIKQTPEQQARFALLREAAALKVAAAAQARTNALANSALRSLDEMRAMTLEEAFSDDAALSAPASVEDFIATMGLEGKK